jgi:hypothetical protein
MADFDRILAVKKAAQARLMAIPGVHAVGIGAKFVGGQRTGETVIHVFVVKKKSPSDLSPQELIPTEIDGIKTDVIETGMPLTAAGRDDSTKRPLDGGLQIVTGGKGSFGTLGCIGHTNDPDQKAVALTCQHVVGGPAGRATQLIMTYSPDQHTITFSGTNTPGSLIDIRMSIAPAGPGDSHVVDAYYMTGASDTLTNIASKVAGAINALNDPGISAAADAANPSIHLTWGNGWVVLLVNQNPSQQFGPIVWDPHAGDSNSDLKITIADATISITGRVSGDHYGLFTNVNLGGTQPTRGTFTALTKNQSIIDVASAIAKAITSMNLSGVTATPTGSTVNVTGVQAIECDVWHDLRVGQATDRFCSACLWLCDRRIGIVIDARLDVDTALIQLDGGMKYKAEIEEIGIVKGVHDVTQNEATPGPYHVQKRGAKTGLTSGDIVSIHVDGYTINADPPDEDNPSLAPSFTLHRHYSEAISVQTPDPSNPGKMLTFAAGGDSGSAVLNMSGELIGILFMASENGLAGVTPISQITTALNVTIATATQVNAVQTVPASVGSPMMAHAEPAFSGAGLAARGAAAPVMARLQEVEREVAATPAGKELADVVLRHFDEVQTLVNTNRRVATAWHRNGGPKIVQSLVRMIQAPDEALPDTIDGRPLSECLARLQKSLARYASPALSLDLTRYTSRLVRLAGLTYPQVLTALRTSGVG